MTIGPLPNFVLFFLLACFMFVFVSNFSPEVYIVIKVYSNSAISIDDKPEFKPIIC